MAPHYEKLSRFPGPAPRLRAEAVLIRRNRRWFVHVLSLALLFAQLGMVVHASTHFKTNPHAAPTQTQLCSECVSFASTQNAVGGTPPVVFAVTVTPDVAPEGDAVSQLPHRAFSAFRSRAPPSFR